MESLPSTEFIYCLIVHDETVHEFDELVDSVEHCLSEAIVEKLRPEAVTDVSIMSHGWKVDVPTHSEAACAMAGTLLGQVLYTAVEARPPY